MSSRRIDIMSGIFNLRCPSDLLEKLTHEYEQLEQDPSNQYVAWNFFVTSEHLIDWLYPGQANRANRTKVRKSELLLQICSHIANGAKHFEVEAKHHQSVAGTDHISHFPEGYFTKGYWTNGYFFECLVIRLENEAAKDFGESIEVLSLAKKVMEFWETEFQAQQD